MPRPTPGHYGRARGMPGGRPADGVLVPLADTGHSALDTHGLAVLRAIEAVRYGDYRALANGTALAELRRLGGSRHLSTALRLGLRAEGLLPGSARRA
ncbi:hypothetical protein [Pseudactinotalea sp. Z1732]|uniref:hypothetical protein n=1 Tax=Micrococcales TaxID=85006 RepID=UPI003C79EC7E